MTNSPPISDREVYRWSREPQSHYANGPNPWIAELDNLRWNLAWLTLADPLYNPAPENFREYLEQKPGLRGHSPTHRQNPCDARSDA